MHSGEQLRIRELTRSFDAAGFTPREKEVALLLCERLSIREIAERLFISGNTVAKHIEHVYLKLGLHGRRHLYEWLLGQGVPAGLGTSNGRQAKTPPGR